MSAIESITIDSILDKRWVHGNSLAARPLLKGSTWNTIRIGARYTLSDSGANLFSGPKPILGVMSNASAEVANGPLSGAATSHYVGLWHPGGGNPTYTREAGPPVRYDGQVHMHRKVGSAVTSITFHNGVKHSADPEIRKTVILQLNKSITTGNAGFLSLDTWSSSDHSYAKLIEAMELPVLGVTQMDGVFAGESYQGSLTSGSITINEGTHGPLNSIVFGWDRQTSRMKFSEILISYWP